MGELSQEQGHVEAKGGEIIWPWLTWQGLPGAVDMIGRRTLVWMLGAREGLASPGWDRT